MNKVIIMPSHPRKKQKSQKYDCKYNEEWEKMQTFIKPSKLGALHAFCSYCTCDVKVSHCGKNDRAQHVKSDKKAENSVKGTAGISSHWTKACMSVYVTGFT